MAKPKTTPDASSSTPAIPPGVRLPARRGGAAPIGAVVKPSEPVAPVPTTESQRIADELGDFDDADITPDPVEASPAPTPAAPIVRQPDVDPPKADETSADEPAKKKRRSGAKPETIDQKRERLEREMSETPEQRTARLQRELDQLNQGKPKAEPLRSSHVNSISARANALHAAAEALGEAPLGLAPDVAASTRTLLLQERDATIREWQRLKALRELKDYENTSYLRPLQFIADGDTFKHQPTARKGEDA